MAVESVTKEIVKRLAEHLRSTMPSLRQVIEDFPEPNQELQYPSISIMSGEPTFRPQPPVERGEPVAAGIGARVKSKYTIGEYDWKMQLDIWAGTKEQRHKLYEEFINAFNSQWPTMGLSLSLSGYHDEVARFDMNGLKFDDSEAGSQRKEWRATVSVLANCEAVIERNEFVIEETELTVVPNPTEELEE